MKFDIFREGKRWVVWLRWHRKVGRFGCPQGYRTKKEAAAVARSAREFWDT